MTSGHRAQLAQARHLLRNYVERAPFGAYGRIGERKAARVGMGGGRKDGSCRPALDCAAGIHHDHLIAELRREAQIMGNENDRRAVLFLHSGNEADDRRVRGDVERGGRLVGDD